MLLSRASGFGSLVSSVVVEFVLGICFWLSYGGPSWVGISTRAKTSLMVMRVGPSDKELAESGEASIRRGRIR